MSNKFNDQQVKTIVKALEDDTKSWKYLAPSIRRALCEARVLGYVCLREGTIEVAEIERVTLEVLSCFDLVGV